MTAPVAPKKRTPKPRPCRQRGVCKHYEYGCPFGRDARKCLRGDTTADEALPWEVD